MRNMKDVDNFDHCLIMDFLKEHKEIYTQQDLPTMQEYVAEHDSDEPVGIFGNGTLDWLDKYTK